jgi:hypothetical protein
MVDAIDGGDEHLAGGTGDHVVEQAYASAGATG